MHLHDESRRRVLAGAPGIDGDHGAFDDVRRRALHRRVDRAALGVLAQLRVARADVGQVQPPAEYRLDVTDLPRLRARLVHEALHAGIALEVALHVLLRRAALDAEVACQAERRHAVHETEVDDLGGAALVGRDCIEADAKHLRGRRLVHVAIRGESRAQAFISRQVRHDAQLDLRVVGRQQHPARWRDERLADAPPLGPAHRDVLQVGIDGGQPPGGGDCLRIVGVNAPGPLIHLLRELIGVGGLELGERAVLEHDPGKRVARGELFQHVFGGRGLAGRGLAPHRQLQPLEQDLLQLLRGLDVEFVAGLAVRLQQQLLQLVRELAALRAQPLSIDEHAVMFHGEQHRHQRLLAFQVQARQRRHTLKLRPQRTVQAQCHVRIFGGILGGALHRHLVETELFRAFAGDVFVADGAHSEIPLCVRVHVVIGGDAVPHVGLEHAVEAHTPERDAGVRQHVGVVLEVVPDLAARGILENGLERREHALAIELFRRAGIRVAQGYVGGHARLDAPGHADDFRLHVVEAGGLGVEGEQLGRAQGREPALQILPAGHGFVAACDVGRRRTRGGRRGGVECLRALRHRGRGGARHRIGAIQLPQQPAQLVARVQLAQARAVRRARHQLLH